MLLILLTQILNVMSGGRASQGLEEDQCLIYPRSVKARHLRVTQNLVQGSTPLPVL
jgi:hypothetical protein